MRIKISVTAQEENDWRRNVSHEIDLVIPDEYVDLLPLTEIAQKVFVQSVADFKNLPPKEEKGE